MSMEWYRVYHGMPYDAKLQVIAKRTGQPVAHVVAVWMCLLDVASQHNPRGTAKIDPEEISVVQGIAQKAVEAILKAFCDKGLMDVEHCLTNWHKRQHTTSTERVQKHRDSKKQEETAGSTVKRDATSGNAKERKKRKIDPDTETDTDSRTDSNSKNRERAEKRESEREKQQIGGKDTEHTEKQILGQMLDIWNAEVQSQLTKGHKAILTPKRKSQMLERWHREFRQDIRAWQYFCEIIGTSEFCLGKIAGKGWTIDLSWAVESAEHVAKILEGGFSGGKHPTPSSLCHDPHLQTGWDHVLACFSDKYSKATCKSWLSGTEVTGFGVQGETATVIIACPNRFIQQWLEQHYLNDLKLWWSEHRYQSFPITSVQLTTQEIRS